MRRYLAKMDRTTCEGRELTTRQCGKLHASDKRANLILSIRAVKGPADVARSRNVLFGGAHRVCGTGSGTWEVVAAPEGRLRRLPAGERIHKRRRWVGLAKVG
jgi:hypothetical protein